MKSMNELQMKLFETADENYAVFQSKLTPSVERCRFIGVRVPLLRIFARNYIKTNEKDAFIATLPHYYYEENMLHALLLSEENNYGTALCNVNAFLPYVDNWAVCDTLKPKAFAKNKDKLIFEIQMWTSSSETYSIRFGIEMLMNYYLDDNFKKDYLEIPLNVKSDEYYVKMMIAWFYATALAKKWEDTIPILENKRLSAWCHNKTIQKAVESYRITDEQKRYLLSLKV